MKKAVQTDKAPAAIGPYSQAIVKGDMLFVSGQLGIDPKTGILVEGIEKQTHQVMENLSAILQQAEKDFSDVVKTSIFLENLEDFSLVNDIYGSYFKTGVPPARETIEVSKLPKNGSIEISLIAI